MILTKTNVTDRGNFHAGDGSYPPVIANPDVYEIHKAYLEFVCNYASNEADVYEKAAAISRIEELKTLFSQLAGKKRDIYNTIKRHLTKVTIAFNPHHTFYNGSFNKSKLDSDVNTLASIKDVIDFTFRRENKTLALYENLLKTAQYSLSKSLFEYLIESQCDCIHYLGTQICALKSRSSHPVPVSPVPELGPVSV